MNAYSLADLNALVQRAVQTTLPSAYWLTAELAGCSVKTHFYGELVQKDDAGRTVASARCNCWQSTYHSLAQKFFQATGGQLRVGLQVMLLVKATFHPQYGFAYNIVDIEPSYTVGDAARRRREILEQLQRQGIMRENAAHHLPLLIQNIAIISSPTAAGYGDFCDQLLRNKQRLRFNPVLFPALMQGNGVEESVMQALSCVAARKDEFDAVVVIRGGGAVTDLDCFDSYSMAQTVALFPLPVFTGIGHERDEVVLDFVAHTRLKTPTAVAAFLIEHNMQQVEHINTMARVLMQSVQGVVQREKSRFENISHTVPQTFARMFERQQACLSKLALRYDAACRINIQRQKSRIDLISRQLQMLDPKRVLERGYTMTTCRGILVTDVNQLKHGDEILTTFATGQIRSVISNT